MDQIQKNAKIRETSKTTRERHSHMLCRVFEVKIVNGKLSQKKKELLDQYFREAKWLRNSELAKGFDNMNINSKTAMVKVGDTYEERPLTILGSQVKQDVVNNLKSEIYGLATKKKKGQKVGQIKFKSYCNSVPLRQYGNTFDIDFNKHTVSIQNMKKYPLKVRGLDQIPADAEIANAKLIRKPSGYYIHITTFVPPEPYVEIGAVCGLDFGIGNNITTNTNEMYNICVPETKAIKLASKRTNQSYHRNGGKKSNNHRKRIHKQQVAYEKLANKKYDLGNKVVHDLLSQYDLIAIQDEMIANWHKGLFGKQVQHSAMGYIKRKLKTNSKVHVVDRSFPSTQKCPVCGKNTKHLLSERSYRCQYCGYYHPSRDAKAAEMILYEVLSQSA